jgi:uncharacterized protein YjdB
LPLQATVKDARGNVLSDRAVYWQVRDTSIARVSATGVVTGRKPGTVQVAASSEGKFAIASVTVLPAAVASVVVLPAQAQLTIGATAQLRAVTYDSVGGVLTGRAVIWASSNQSVATVNGDGLVTALATGTATITATSEGKTGTGAVTVSPVPVATVTVTPEGSPAANYAFDVTPARLVTAVVTERGVIRCR